MCFFQKIDKWSGPKVSSCPRTHIILSLQVRLNGRNRMGDGGAGMVGGADTLVTF